MKLQSSNAFLRELIKNFIILISGRVGAAVLQASALLLLARWASVEDFGKISAALGLIVVMQALADGGATTYITRESAIHGNNRKVAQADALSKTLCFSLFGIYSASVLFLIIANDQNLHPLLPLGVWLILERAHESRIAIARGQGNIGIGSRSLILRRAIHLLGFISLYFLFKDPLWAYTIALACGSWISFLLMQHALPTPRSTKISRVTLLSAFSKCRPYWLHTISSQARNLDSFIVALLSGPIHSALYGIGARLISPLRMIPSSLSTALLPNLSKSRLGIDYTIKLGLLFSTIIAIPYIGVAFATPMLLHLIGDHYKEAILPLQIICIGLLGASFISVFNTIMHANGQANEVAKTSVISAFITLTMISTGALAYNSIGAAVGFSISTLLHALLAINGAYKHAKR